MYDCLPNCKPPTDRFIMPRSFSQTPNLYYPLPFSMPSYDLSDAYYRFIGKYLLTIPMIDYTKYNPLYHNNYHMSTVRSLLTKRIHHIDKKPIKRNIHTSPYKILDAPDIKDDYYLNLLDWSSRGILAIGLGERVYLYSTSQIGQLCYKYNNYICSLGFHPQGEQLAIGLYNGKIYLYDMQTQQLIRTLKGHTDRVSSSSFTYGMLFTGSRDRKILGHDYRTTNSIVMKFQGHRGEVCGLKHDACGLASGSNDNQAIIWDLNTAKIRYQLLGHNAAVKAIAWCPWQKNLLATGGGTSDKTMRFWNVDTGKQINVVNTYSQVCSLIWNKNGREILSSHGFSENQLSLWRYPYCCKIAELKGHTQRVLHMAMAPDNATICTASADYTLRFWKVFEGKAKIEADYKKDWNLNPKFCGLR